MKRIIYRLIMLTSLNMLSLLTIKNHGLAQALKPPVELIRQVEPTPDLTPILPGTPVPGAPELLPTLPLTTSVTATPAVTPTLPITQQSPSHTPTSEIQAGEVLTATQTAEAGAGSLVTPTPFQYIRVQPREVARSLLEKITGSVLILFGGFGVASLARFLSTRLVNRVHPDVQIFIGRLVYIAVWVGAILWILRVFEVEVATLTAIVGTLGLALSLSSQDLFKNFIAGIYLLLERPFYVGDVIKVGDYSGRVEFIDLRTTKLVTEDGKQVILPNTALMSQVVVRQSEVAGQD